MWENNSNINIRVTNKTLEAELQSVLEDIPKEQTKHLIDVYFNIRVQECINSWKYEDIKSYEGLTELYNLLDTIG